MDKKIAGGLPRHLEVAQWATNNLIACSDGECKGGEPVHCVAADAQHRARLVGAVICDVLEAEASDQASLASWVANIRPAADEMATRIADMLMHVGGD